MISCGMVREGPSGKTFAQSKDDLREECHMANSLGELTERLCSPAGEGKAGGGGPAVGRGSTLIC